FIPPELLYKLCTYISMWNQFLRNYFTFNRRERNGLIVLLLIMLLITFWPAIYARLYHDPLPDFAAFKASIDSFETIASLKKDSNGNAEMESASIAALDHSGPGKEAKENAVVHAPFDP